MRFENIGMQEIMQELLGGMSFLTHSLLGENDFKLNITLATEMQLDWEGELQNFQTCAKAEDQLDLLYLRGQRTEQDRLRISMFAGGNAEPLPVTPLSQEFALPAKAQLSDAFSPRSRMVGLRVGQKWTTPVVSPVGGTNSVRLVESLVEKLEYISMLLIRFPFLCS